MIAGIDLSPVLPLALSNYWKERALIIIEILGNFFSIPLFKTARLALLLLAYKELFNPGVSYYMHIFLYPNNSFVWYLFTILQTHRQSD